MTEPTFPPTEAPPPRTGGGSGYLRIATEEAFATPELIKIWLDMIEAGYDDPGSAACGASTARPPRSVPASSSGPCRILATGGSRTWTPPAWTARSSR